MKCNNCGGEVEKDWIRCPKCMEYLNKTCPSCNENIDFNWKACPKCGYIFQDNINYQENTEIPVENKTQIYGDAPVGKNSKIFQKNIMNPEFSEFQTNERAGFGIRFGAYIIDYLLIIGIGFLLLVILYYGGGYYWSDSDFGAAFYLIYISTFIMYFTYCEGVKGQTLGKKLLHLKVVSEEGVSPIGIKKALLRTTLGRFLAGIFFGIGYIIIAINQDDRQGLHDQIAKTYVIKLKR